ncbi:MULTISPECIES: WG repeat-containing protein [unclassified Holdemania]|uniref:WG repeat-containing protein n=1 Tax=unclassified Holdemania TaxID=2637685 RepID=UPI00093453CA|nr:MULTISPECIES: WG repeat-containing protein [unclassified Holdemania]
MRRFSLLILGLFLMIGCSTKTKPQSSSTFKPKTIPCVEATPASTPAVEGEIEVALYSTTAGSRYLEDNIYYVVEGDDRLKTGSLVILRGRQEIEQAALRVIYQPEFNYENDLVVLNDYEIEAMEPVYPDRDLLTEISFDAIYPLIQQFPQSEAELELVEGYFILEKAGLWGVAGPHEEVIVPITGRRAPVLDSLDLHCDAQAYDFSLLLDTPYHLCWGEHGISAKAIYGDVATGTAYLVQYGHDGPGIFHPFDGSRMSGELGLYHAVSGYSETPEGLPEYEWLDRVGVVNQKGELITGAIYDQGLAINGDLIPVARDGLWGYVNAAGEEIIPCQYLAPLPIDPDRDRWAAYPLDHGRIVAQDQSGRYGVLGMDGSILIPFEYDFAAPFYDGQILLEKAGERTIQ